MLRPTLWILLTSLTLTATPLKLVAIGDSLTEEYSFEIPFSAPVSDPGDANVRNWVELLMLFRSDQVTLGTYADTALDYRDLRNGGYARNFGIPSWTAERWIEILDQPPVDEVDAILDPDTYGEAYIRYRTKLALRTQLLTADAVLIMLGGNDLKGDYTEIYAGTAPQSFFDDLVARFAYIHDWIRSKHPGIPIILATTPDVGATPTISNSPTYSNPTLAAAARARIASFNADLASMVASRASTIARVDRLTDRLFDEVPFHFNGTVLTIEGDPENPSDHLFCRDDFHPSTAGQALILNEILAALNTATGSNIPLFSERTILQSFLVLNPDQPYLDWIAGFPLAADGVDEDPDGDRLPNLIELALGTPPHLHSSPLSGTWSPGNALTWSPDPTAARYLTLGAEESSTLNQWTPVPKARLTSNPDGTLSASPAVAPDSFLRLRATPR